MSNNENPISINEYQSSINPELASEVIDTTIVELLPDQGTRQGRIDAWFAEFFNLVPNVPSFTQADHSNGVGPEIDSPEAWNGIGENSEDPNASIIRLSEEEDDVNTNKSIESFRNSLNAYLQDIDYKESLDEDDGRPIYKDKSSGFLKIRNLNQSILIKQEEGKEISFSELKYDEDMGLDIPKWQIDGFTITMWVRFKDKINGGTLFNYGNPTRLRNPMGFKLETFTLKNGDINVPDEFAFENGESPFQTENYERFVRLVVRDKNGKIRDSHVGMASNERIDTTSEGIPEVLNDNSELMLNYTRIPIDLEEWYFIVANYNPGITEDFESFNGDDAEFLTSPDYWRWNYASDGFEFNTGIGAQCKVEIISKSDLIRARGFKKE